MSKPFSSTPEDQAKGLDLARVLLKHADLASRLALQTILRAGGYAVDAAATPSEALCKLDEGKYDLVLSDGRNVLSYAKVKDYRPATALITSSQPMSDSHMWRRDQFAVYTENLPTLLSDVAELIGIRASRRYRPLRDM